MQDHVKHKYISSIPTASAYANNNRQALPPRAGRRDAAGDAAAPVADLQARLPLSLCLFVVEGVSRCLSLPFPNFFSTFSLKRPLFAWSLLAHA